MRSLDVVALEQLVGLVGPLEIDGATEPLTADNTSQFPLFDQYRTQDADARSDMLEQVARTTIDRRLTETPPDPVDLAKATAPRVKQRRAYSWSANDDEQQIVTAANLSDRSSDGVRWTFS